MSDKVLKRATYECGCQRGVVGVQGQEPRPPMRCPDHDEDWTKLETLPLEAS